MMEDQALYVFGLRPGGVTLRMLHAALRRQDYPIGIGVEIAGEALDVQLDDPDWETAFVRWHEPELHDVWLLERDLVGTDEEAEDALASALKLATGSAESADKLIVLDHLSRTEVVYACRILPAMLDDEDHPAWAALDVALRTLAAPTDGLIYAEDDTFYDADGEPLVLETT